MYFYIFFLVLSVVIVRKIYRIQHSWEPIQEHIENFLPPKSLLKTTPRRGSIIDHNGKLLAISTPLYDLRMDCCVQKEHYAKDPKTCEAKENEWLAKADALAGKLAKTLPQDKAKDSAYYSNLIRSSRKNGHRNVLLAKNIDHVTLEAVEKLPLLNEPPHKGGRKVEEKELRLYPYEGLVRRVIGYVNTNNPDGYVGIEGKYDHILRGKAGYEWARRTDKFNMIGNVDSTAVDVEDGKDIRTTIDINIQDMAERALRSHIDTTRHINSGCVVVMDVETGAVRAMVNLKRDSLGKMRESFNFAAGHPGEPGSIFKTVILTTLLEDGLVNLDDKMEVKEKNMHYPGFKSPERDRAAFSYIDRHDCTHIPVIDGFMVSSNFVFRRQAVDHYMNNPEELITRLHSYNLGADFNFELTEKGSGRSSIPDPHGAGWSQSTIPSIGIGYSVKVTPLQILSFYNAIANDGKMMQPYIVESIEKDGKVIEAISPKMLNVICSKATTDTLLRAMKKVTHASEGTAYRSLRGVRCEVAGKTGTAKIALTAAENPAPGKSYETVDGKSKYQASFAGFFPADNPKYSAIVTVYTDPMSTVRYEGGGGRPARVFRDIVNEILIYEGGWNMETTSSTGKMPDISTELDRTTEAGKAPDLIGLGLKDAIYFAEKAGFRCEYSGIGHVSKQETKGNTIKVTLK